MKLSGGSGGSFRNNFRDACVDIAKHQIVYQRDINRLGIGSGAQCQKYQAHDK
jgi:hypothetical protein